MPNVLLILTGTKVWTMKDGTPHPTGFWAHEFMAPHQIFIAAGCNVSIVTPHGVEPTPDPLGFSVAYNDNDPSKVAAQKEYLKKLDREFKSTLRLQDVKPNDFDVAFIVGGHGPMQDLAVDPYIGDLLVGMAENPRKIIGAVCHGPAGYLSAAKSDGTWFFKGRKITGFSNEEETQATFAGNAPWLLEDRLRLAGGLYSAKPAWTPNVVVDGNIVTGQQQNSPDLAAQTILDQLKVPA
jgi:putative intracellular protease/amidase